MVVKNSHPSFQIIPRRLLFHYRGHMHFKSGYITSDLFFLSFISLSNPCKCTMIFFFLLFQIQTFEFWLLFLVIFSLVEVLFVFNLTIGIYKVFQFDPFTFNFLIFCLCYFIKVFMACNLILQIKFMIFVFCFFK